MNRGRNSLLTFEAPSPSEVGKTVEEFLEYLGGPAWLYFPGEDGSRTRALSTLLHGNEPSGVRAVFEWIQSRKRPAVNLVCFIGAVEAALARPYFATRFLPGRKDLNRCFREPFEGPEGDIAAEALSRLRRAKPEALLDLHNTSGTSPCYAVSTRRSPAHESLARLFSRHFILTDLRLGTLMEATEETFPTLTIECGGARDSQSTTVATEGFFRYATADRVVGSDDYEPGMAVLKHPIRVELGDGARVAYRAAPDPDVDITFQPGVDRYNFGEVQAGQVLGWLGARGLSALIAHDAQGRNRIHDIFAARDGTLEVVQRTRFFMITTDPAIARSDCLFYAIPAETPMDQG